MSGLWERSEYIETVKPFWKGSEDLKTTENQTVRLIEWLKKNGFTDAQIVDCIQYINKKMR